MSKNKSQHGVDKYGSRLGSNRAKINEKLTSKPKTMTQLVKEANLDPAQTHYNHLDKLVEKGLVEKTGEGYRTLLGDDRPAEMYRQADSKGRIALPGFANVPVIIKKIDETEYRVLRARVIAEKELVNG